MTKQHLIHSLDQKFPYGKRKDEKGYTFKRALLLDFMLIKVMKRQGTLLLSDAMESEYTKAERVYLTRKASISQKEVTEVKEDIIDGDEEPVEPEPVEPEPLDSGNIEPANKIPGWNLRKEYVDEEHNVFEKGKFVGKDESKEPTQQK